MSQETEQPTAEQVASEASAAPPEQMSLVSEFILFLRENKKWWLIPIILMILFLGAILIFSSTPAAPFIYTLF